MAPETAQRIMARWGSIMTGGGKAFTSIFASFLPFMDYERPIRFSAVYFPAWIINAEVDADVIEKDSQKSVKALFRNTYIPGSNVPLLSIAPLWARTLDSVEPMPFTESLLRQYGEDVQCIPFSISPFSVLDVPASSTNSSWSITQDIKVVPSSIKPNLFSAYPVLLPLYIAQYKVEEPESGQDTVTVFIRAHEKKFAGVMVEKILEAEPILTALNAFGNLSFVKNMNLEADVIDVSPERNPRVRLLGASLRPAEDKVNFIAKWLDGHLSSYENIEKLTSLSDLASDDDPRIREMTDEEQHGVDRYFRVVLEIMLMKRINEAMSKITDRQGTVLSLAKGSMLPKLGSVEDASLTVQTRLKELEGQLKDLKPRWWVEWEEASCSKPEPSDQK
ncbi:hypothetical protein GALMADRAFT_247474 [Galerina marginata CBS 339.88]|uniref:Uncharacterized protein n=1 Tax=Galerina marginata (strain CBS 339.88) TaxID=685588 RepID=A0A067SZ93_GALM3|nr:hypothetical protein GALMADRAFT_247474 [Galerina marginata CBS 339.88]